MDGDRMIALRVELEGMQRFVDTKNDIKNEARFVAGSAKGVGLVRSVVVARIAGMCFENRTDAPVG